nr:hypothetical protein [uncultured Dongia sp.]
MKHRLLTEETTYLLDEIDRLHAKFHAIRDRFGPATDQKTLDDLSVEMVGIWRDIVVAGDKLCETHDDDASKEKPRR